MGLNRSSPAVYGASAKKVLDLAPEWVLAEHGGPYVFDAEDYRRRVKWGAEAAKACDALCVSGSHLKDWTPHRVTAEPHLQTAKAGGRVNVLISLTGEVTEHVTVSVPAFEKGVIYAPGNSQLWGAPFTLPADIKPGRHIFPVKVSDKHGVERADTYFAVDVE